MAKCPTCGAASEAECAYRYQDIGCDHPAVVEEIQQALNDLLSGNLVRESELYFAGWLRAYKEAGRG